MTEIQAGIFNTIIRRKNEAKRTVFSQAEILASPLQEEFCTAVEAEAALVFLQQTGRIEQKNSFIKLNTNALQGLEIVIVK